MIKITCIKVEIVPNIHNLRVCKGATYSMLMLFGARERNEYLIDNIEVIQNNFLS